MLQLLASVSALIGSMAGTPATLPTGIFSMATTFSAPVDESGTDGTVCGNSGLTKSYAVAAGPILFTGGADIIVNLPPFYQSYSKFNSKGSLSAYSWTGGNALITLKKKGSDKGKLKFQQLGIQQINGGDLENYDPTYDISDFTVKSKNNSYSIDFVIQVTTKWGYCEMRVVNQFLKIKG